MKVLVTGAAGMIGRSVLEALRRAGHSARAIVRPAGTALDARAAAQIVALDVRDRIGVREAMAGVEAVVHLAGHGGRSDDDVRTTIVEGTRAVVDAAGAARCRVLVFFSSTAVYGSGDLVDLDESHPRRAVSSYGRAKIAAEDLVLEADAAGVFEGYVFRPCDAFGGSDRYFGKLLVDLASGGVVPLCRGGAVRYDVVAADDLAAATLAAITRRRVGDQSSESRALNLTGGENLTVAELAVRLGAHLGRALQTAPIVDGRPLPEGVWPWLVPLVGEHRSFSIARARAVLGYAPRVRFPQTLSVVDQGS